MEELRAFKKTIIHFSIPCFIMTLIIVLVILNLVKDGFVSYPSGHVNFSFIFPIVCLMVFLGFLSLYAKRFRVRHNDAIEEIRLSVYGAYVWLIPLFGPIIFYKRMYKKACSINLPNDKFSDNMKEQGFRQYAEAMASSSSDKDAKFWDDVVKDIDSIEAHSTSMKNKEFKKKESKKNDK